MTPELVKTTTAAAGGAVRPEPNSWSLAALATPVLLSSLGAGIANVGLPALADAFDASFHAVQWVVLAYLLAITTLIVGVGRLADLVGRRRLLLGGLALFTVASLASASAPALWVLVAARAVQGLGAAVMMTLAMALVGDATPPERTGRAMGVLGSMSAVGTALGPALGGLLLEVAGWRGLFLINVPLGAVALLLAHRHLPPDRELRDVGRPAFDLPGTLLLALTLGAYALAMIAGRGEDGYLNVALLLLAALGGAAFVRSQARSQSPLLHLDLLRGGTLGVQLLVSVVASAVVMATLVVGPFYLARGLGLAPAVIGGVLSVGPLVSAAAGVPAGRLVDRLGARGSTAVGLAGMAAGSVLLAALRPSLGIIGYVLPIAALTASYALVQAANNAAAMMDVRADRRGVVAALLGLSRNLGLVTGASAMAAVFALATGVPEVAVASPDAAAAGLRVTFALAAALAFLTLAVVMRGSWVRTVATAVVVMSVGTTRGRTDLHQPLGRGLERAARRRQRAATRGDAAPRSRLAAPESRSATSSKPTPTR